MPNAASRKSCACDMESSLNWFHGGFCAAVSASARPASVSW